MLRLAWFSCVLYLSSSHPISRSVTQTNHGNQLVSCPNCEETFNSKTEWKAHWRATHDPEGNTISQCKICLRTFTFPKQLELHAAAHSNEKLPGSKSRSAAAGGSSRETTGAPSNLSQLLPPSLPSLNDTAILQCNEAEMTAVQVDDQTFVLQRLEDGTLLSIAENHVDVGGNDMFIIPQMQEVDGVVIDEVFLRS